MTFSPFVEEQSNNHALQEKATSLHKLNLMIEFQAIFCVSSFLILCLYLLFVQSKKVSPSILQAWEAAGESLGLTLSKPKFGLQTLTGNYKNFEVIISTHRAKRISTSYTIFHQNDKMALFELSPKPTGIPFVDRVDYVQNFDRRFKHSYGNEEFANALFSNEKLRNQFAPLRETYVYFDREKVTISEHAMETEKENIIARLDLAVRLTEEAIEVVNNAQFKIRRY